MNQKLVSVHETSSQQFTRFGKSARRLVEYLDLHLASCKVIVIQSVYVFPIRSYFQSPSAYPV